MNGDSIWQRAYALLPAGANGNTVARAVRQTDDDADGQANDGYVVAGHADTLETSSFSDDVWVLKLNAAGDAVWQRRYGGEILGGGASSDDLVSGAELDTSGNLVIVGSTLGDLMLLELDASGDVVLEKNLRGSEPARHGDDPIAVSRARSAASLHRHSPAWART